ncbi:MAG: DUF4239 domain-containing protein [Methylomonas sp.]|nr:MAG: DUF4239 domain-containing protein [Methylomonas sp.]
MSHTFLAIIASTGLFFGIVLSYFLGGWIAKRWPSLAKIDSGSTSMLDSAIYALMGLLIAFTFSGAASRFDDRRILVINEANAIGTAYLRLDLLPAEAQLPLRDLFRRYVDARLEMSSKLPDIQAAAVSGALASHLQDQIWPVAVKACQDSGSVPTTTLLLAALNDMFDLATYRNTVRTELHPPQIIFMMLLSLAMISACLAGYACSGSLTQNRVHLFAFALITAGTFYVILDLEYPRLGLIRIDSVDKVMLDLRNSMD